MAAVCLLKFHFMPSQFSKIVEKKYIYESTGMHKKVYIFQLNNFQRLKELYYYKGHKMATARLSFTFGLALSKPATRLPSLCGLYRVALTASL